MYYFPQNKNYEKNNNRTDFAPNLKTNSSGTISSIVVFITLLGFQINYLIVFLIFGPEGGYGISLEFFSTIVIVMIGLLNYHKFLANQKKIALIFTFFVFWVLIGSLYTTEISLMELKNFVVLLLTIAGGYYFFFRYWQSIQERLPIVIVSTIIAFNILFFALIITGKYDFVKTTLGHQQQMRINIVGFGPNELSAFLGIQFIYLIYLLKIKFKRNFIIILLAMNIGMILMTGSTGAALGIILLTILYISSMSFLKKIFLVLVFLLFAYLISHNSYINEVILKPYYIFSTNKYERFSEGTYSRSTIYETLWSLAVVHPVFGIGNNQFMNFSDTGNVPHHNILGRACENGFPAAIFYTLFLFCSLYALKKIKKFVMSYSKRNNELANSAYFIEACFMALLYIQFRGLFMDTWTMKEQYFLVGAGLGIGDYIRRKIRNEKTYEGSLGVWTHAKIES